MLKNNMADSLELIEENLTSKRITAVCQNLLLTCDQIWGISIRNCLIGDSDFEKLLRAMKKCKILRYLNLNINFITTNERLNQLTTVLTSLAYLDTLCLHSSNLNDDGLKLLYYSLVNLRNLRSLDIGDCGLSDQSVDYIREIIHRKEHPHGLTELILSYNQKITPLGWSKILIAVASSADLKYLYIDYNHLDDSCGYLIVAALCSNHALEVLDLESTGITDKTALLLAYLFKNYKQNLKSINLIMNKIDQDLSNEISTYVNNPESASFALADLAAMQTTKLPSKLDPSSLRDLKRPTSNVKGRAELKMRDEFKMAEYVKNGYEFQKARDFRKNEYERLLERDFEKVKRDNSASTSSKSIIYPHVVVAATPKIIVHSPDEPPDITTNEFLKTYEDLRFKNHNVLPFNLK